jgi:hypothetical protein
VTELHDSGVVRDGRASQREAAVPPAGAAGDLARVVEAHAHAALRECQRTRAARDTAADHCHFRASLKRAPWQRFGRLVEPI